MNSKNFLIFFVIVTVKLIFKKFHISTHKTRQSAIEEFMKNITAHKSDIIKKENFVCKLQSIMMMKQNLCHLTSLYFVVYIFQQQKNIYVVQKDDRKII